MPTNNLDTCIHAIITYANVLVISGWHEIKDPVLNHREEYNDHFMKLVTTIRKMWFATREERSL